MQRQGEAALRNLGVPGRSAASGSAPRGVAQLKREGSDAGMGADGAANRPRMTVSGPHGEGGDASASGGAAGKLSVGKLVVSRPKFRSIPASAVAASELEKRATAGGEEKGAVGSGEGGSGTGAGAKGRNGRSGAFKLNDASREDRILEVRLRSRGVSVSCS